MQQHLWMTKSNILCLRDGGEPGNTGRGKNSPFYRNIFQIYGQESLLTVLPAHGLKKKNSGKTQYIVSPILIYFIICNISIWRFIFQSYLLVIFHSKYLPETQSPNSPDSCVPSNDRRIQTCSLSPMPLLQKHQTPGLAIKITIFYACVTQDPDLKLLLFLHSCWEMSSSHTASTTVSLPKSHLPVQNPLL